MWPSSSSRVAGASSVPPPPPLGYGLPPELGMFVVTPAAAFHHHHHSHSHSHSHSDPSSLIPSADLAASTALGVGVIPLLTAAPCLNNNTNAAGGGIDDGDFRGLGGGARSIHLWQAQDHQHQHEVNYLKSKGGSISFDQHTAPDNLLDGGGGGGIGIGGGGLGGGGGIGGGGPAMTCQDCGNQAKKDCSHRRCRTCCRSRGFDCSTHVRSTWVPAARRRERQMLSSSSKGGGGGDRTSSGSTSGAKKPRLITSQNTTTTSHTSISNTPPRSYDTTSSHQDPNLKDTLPGQVCAPAVFKCVRVTAVEDGGEDEYAYQAVVRIGGHIFKGFLYDQGVESRGGSGHGGGGGDGNFPNLSDLHLGGGRNGGGASSSSPLIDPTTTDVYGAGSVTGLGGAGFGNTIT